MITSIIIVIGVVLFSMTVHEVTHGLVAYWLGDDTAKAQGRLTLNPIKHVDPFLTLLLPVILVIIGGPIFGGAKPVPYNPARVRFDEWGAALVAIAGPLTNLVLAFVFFSVGVIFNLDITTLTGVIVNYFVAVNLGFFVFNIIPIPPLDGSRVLYALAPEPVQQVMRTIERYGIVLVFVIVMLGSSAIGLFMSTAIQAIYRVFSGIYGL